MICSIKETLLYTHIYFNKITTYFIYCRKLYFMIQLYRRAALKWTSFGINIDLCCT